MEGARVTSQHFSHLGYFNISIELEAYDFELESETMFECVLTIPHTGYQLQEKIVYFPGQIPTLKSTKFSVFFFFLFLSRIFPVCFLLRLLMYCRIFILPTCLPTCLPTYLSTYLPTPYFLIPCHLPCVCVLDVCVVCVCSTLKLPSNFKPGILKTEYDKKKATTFHSITFWGTPKPVNYIMNEI